MEANKPEANKPEAIKQTIGNYRVGINFNPSGDDKVGTIKYKSAEIIDFLSELMKEATDGEVKRCYAEAMTTYENAAMWAVKAITKQNYN